MENSNGIKPEEVNQDNKNIEPMDEELLESLNDLRYVDEENIKQSSRINQIKDTSIERYKFKEIIIPNEDK